MSKESVAKASAKYDKANCAYYTFKLNKKTDADILAFLSTIDNKQLFIKELLREYLYPED